MSGGVAVGRFPVGSGDMVMGWRGEDPPSLAIETAPSFTTTNQDARVQRTKIVHSVLLVNC